MIKSAMILAAGRGERMRPLTDTCPKPLLQINGKALIVYHLEALKRAGVETVVINVSWLAEKMIAVLGDGEQFGLNIIYSHEAEALETAGGIIQAMDFLADEFIVVNGDVFTDYDFSLFPDVSYQAHLVMVPNPLHNPQGDFSIKQGMLSTQGAERFTFSGISGYRKSFFSGVPAGESPLAPLLSTKADQLQVSAEIHLGKWNDVGTVERLEALCN